MDFVAHVKSEIGCVSIEKCYRMRDIRIASNHLDQCVPSAISELQHIHGGNVIFIESLTLS